MAISFEESMRMAAEKDTLRRDVSTASFLQTRGGSSAFVAGAESWELSSEYKYYTDYSDDRYSKVDGDKNIILASGQINLTQETNSQYIPFEMPRYYDGFDLRNTKLSFHFVNQGNYEGYPTPINVYYGDDAIRLAWLVDKNVTSAAGVVSFEILAIGTNSMGDEYVWRTKPCSGINIIKALSGSGMTPPLPQSDYYKKNEANTLFATKGELSSIERSLEEKIANLDNDESDEGSDPVYSVVEDEDGDFELVIS